MNIIPYYPEIEVEEYIYGSEIALNVERRRILGLRTFVRKEFDGKWYRWIIKDHVSFSLGEPIEDYPMFKSDVINNFHCMAYFILIRGVDPEKETSYLELDELQISEVERLEQLTLMPKTKLNKDGKEN